MVLQSLVRSQRNGDSMLCKYECHMIGGPYIAENPDCPVHGAYAEGTHGDRQEAIREILYRVWLRDLSSDDGYDLICDLL